MTELPIIVNTNEVTVGGVVDQVELQLSVGAQGERGSRIFSGNVSPLTLPVDSPFWAGYTEFIPGDVYIERSVDVISLWEWKLQIGGYTWVKTAEVAVSNEAPEPLDQDLEAIAALAGTTGLLRKTATNTWALDTNSYLTSVADDSHSHTSSTISALDAGDTTTGTFNIARIPTGTTGTTVALGNHTHSGYQAADNDLTAIAALAGTSGLLRKTATNTWTLDTTSYLSLSQADANYANRLVTTVDNTVPRFDGTTGLIQTSGVTIDDANDLTARRLNAEYVNRSDATQTFDRWYTGGVLRFIQQTTDTTTHFFAADNSGGWYPTGKNVYSVDRATGKFTIRQPGSTAGLEFGSFGPRMMVGTGGPAGISAPVGSTWRQTDANSTYGSLTGLLWNKVGTGTTEGTDWLVDFEGRWVSWSPTITAGAGSYTTTSYTAKYTRQGKTIHLNIVILLTTIGTGSGACVFTLPATARSTPPHPVGSGRADALSGKMLQSKLTSTTQAAILTYDNAGFTSSGEALNLSLTYELA